MYTCAKFFWFFFSASGLVVGEWECLLRPKSLLKHLIQCVIKGLIECVDVKGLIKCVVKVPRVLRKFCEESKKKDAIEQAKHLKKKN